MLLNLQLKEITCMCTICQVHYQRSVKRVSSKVNTGAPSLADKAFTMIAYDIPDATSRATVNLLFDVLAGIKPISALTKIWPKSTLLKDYEAIHNNESWKQCTDWCQWWRRPNHLSK